VNDWSAAASSAFTSSVGLGKMLNLTPTVPPCTTTDLRSTWFGATISTEAISETIDAGSTTFPPVAKENSPDTNCPGVFKVTTDAALSMVKSMPLNETFREYVPATKVVEAYGQRTDAWSTKDPGNGGRAAATPEALVRVIWHITAPEYANNASLPTKPARMMSCVSVVVNETGETAEGPELS